MSVEDYRSSGPSVSPPASVASSRTTSSESSSTQNGNALRRKRRKVSADEEEDSQVDVEEGSRRVPLACFQCRAKKVRCSGTRPLCEACQKASIACEWPSGRRKKRTRKEIEEAKMFEEARGPSMASSGEAWEVPNPTSSAIFEISKTWDAPPSSYLWPSNESSTQPVAQTGMSEIPDLMMLEALQKQTAFIEGDLGDQDLELFYYRFSGPTAMHPGINRISLKLQRRTDSSTPITAVPQPDSQLPQLSIRDSAQTFDASGMPHPYIYGPLFDLFFTHLSQHFPSISRQRMNERLDSGTMSHFLANCICALGARFSEDAQNDPTRACAPFIDKAQELIVPLLHIPTNDVATGLLLLAWASFGQNSESGLWQYSGMAIRMAIDLGIFEVSEIYESAAHVVRTRLLFWSLFVTDRIVAFSAGRPASIPEDSVEIQLPQDDDFFPDPARNTPGSPFEPVEPVPFVQLTKLMIIVGRISNVLNGPRGRTRTLVSTISTDEPLAERLRELQVMLVQFLGELPPSLQWTADNFKHQAARGHGGAFLALHLWVNAVLALIYHPELLHTPSGIETPLNQSMNRSLKLALASSRQVSECMVFADLVANTSYTSTPYATQPLYVAAMAFIHEMRTSQSSVTDGNDPNKYSADIFFLSMARQNFSALLNALHKMNHCWAGAVSAVNVLEKRSGFARADTRSMTKTFISLPDKGILRRFTTDREHPHNVAPATETSLRESIAKSEPAGPSPYWLADLMNSYMVENTSFATADSLDLGRFLWANDDAPVANTTAAMSRSDGVSSCPGFGTGGTSMNGLGRSNGMEGGRRGQHAS